VASFISALRSLDGGGGVSIAQLTYPHGCGGGVASIAQPS
jgi:hypothetical protein